MPSTAKPKPLSSSKNRMMQTGIGFASGIIVSGMFQPLEVLKMAIILTPKQSGKFYQKITTYIKIVSDQHGFKGFWNGLTPAIIRNSIGNILYFLPLRIFEEKFSLSPFMASGLARIVSCASINPLSVLETRFVVPGPKQHKNVFTAIKTLYTQQGIRTFWKGLVPSCLKEGIFAGIYYKLYIMSKNTTFGFPTIDRFLSGLLAGCCATVISHPLEVVRAKMQSGTGFIYSRLSEGVKEINRKEGLGGFMKGVTPRLAKKPLINATTFLVFEGIESFALERWGDKF